MLAYILEVDPRERVTTLSELELFRGHWTICVIVGLVRPLPHIMASNMP